MDLYVPRKNHLNSWLIFFEALRPLIKLHKVFGDGAALPEAGTWERRSGGGQQPEAPGDLGRRAEAPPGLRVPSSLASVKYSSLALSLARPSD